MTVTDLKYHLNTHNDAIRLTLYFSFKTSPRIRTCHPIINRDDHLSALTHSSL